MNLIEWCHQLWRSLFPDIVCIWALNIERKLSVCCQWIFIHFQSSGIYLMKIYGVHAIFILITQLSEETNEIKWVMSRKRCDMGLTLDVDKYFLTLYTSLPRKLSGLLHFGCSHFLTMCNEVLVSWFCFFAISRLAQLWRLFLITILDI